MQRRNPFLRNNDDDDDNQMAAAAVVASPCTSMHNWNSWSNDVLRSGFAVNSMTAPLSTYRSSSPNFHSPQQHQQKRFVGGRQHHNATVTSGGMIKQQLSPGMQDVASWLKSLRLHKYTEMLQAMSYEDMLALDEESLIERGVTAGARRKLIQCVNKLRERVALLRSFVDERGELLIDVNVVLGEVRLMLSTPLKPYDVFGQQGFGAAMTDLDEKNVPGHLICLLERIHERRCRYRKNLDTLMNLLEVYERVKKHPAFTESQRRRVVTWSSALVTMIKQQQPDLLAQKRAAKEGMTRNGYRNRRHDARRQFLKTLTIPPPPKSTGDVLEDANNRVFYWSRLLQILSAQSQLGGPSQEELLALKRQCHEELQAASNQIALEIDRRRDQDAFQQQMKRRHQLQQQAQQPPPQQQHFLLQHPNTFLYRRWSNGSNQKDSSGGFENSRSGQPPSMPLSTFTNDFLAVLPDQSVHSGDSGYHTSPPHLSYNDWNNIISNSPQVPSSASSTSSASFHSLSDRSSAGSPPQDTSPPVLSTRSPAPSLSSNDSDESFDFVVFEFNEHTFDDAVCNDFSIGMFHPRPAPIGSGRKTASLSRPEPQRVKW